jgi:hypothetical protein
MSCSTNHHRESVNSLSYKLHKKIRKGAPDNRIAGKHNRFAGVCCLTHQEEILWEIGSQVVAN